MDQLPEHIYQWAKAFFIWHNSVVKKKKKEENLEITHRSG